MRVLGQHTVEQL